MNTPTNTLEAEIDKILEDFFFPENIARNSSNDENIIAGAKTIVTLIHTREQQARIDELNRISADLGEAIPYKHDSFAMGMNFYQSRIADRLAELRQKLEEFRK